MCFFFLVVTFYLRQYFILTRFQNKAKRSVSNSWWPLNRGKNNRRTHVGMAKRWLWPLNRGLIYNYIILQLFQDFDYWLPNRGWLLNR